MKIELPCENCITLPICKSLPNKCVSCTHFIIKLTAKCSIIHGYLYNGIDFKLYKENMKNIKYQQGFLVELDKIKKRELKIKAFFYPNDELVQREYRMGKYANIY